MIDERRVEELIRNAIEEYAGNREKAQEKMEWSGDYKSQNYYNKNQIVRGTTHSWIAIRNTLIGPDEPFQTDWARITRENYIAFIPSVSTGMLTFDGNIFKVKD